MLPQPKRIEFEDGTVFARSADRYLETDCSPRLQKAVTRNALDGYNVQFQIEQLPEKYPTVRSDYGYSVCVNEDGVLIKAKTEWGAIAACSTILQLNPENSLRYCHIDDHPSYVWRGLMIDVARHFMSVEILKKNLDLMSYFRMNVLHLHLTDDQGFRFPCLTYPQLASDQCYTREELHELIEYAADRGIRLIPEVDVLGHTHSWLVNYPEWGLEQVGAGSKQFGVHKACLNPSNPDVANIVETVFKEVADCFPDEFIHIGGDEVNPNCWLTNAEFRQWMHQEGFDDTKSVETAFNSQLVRMIEGWEKRAIGWDEVLHNNMPRDIAVQIWRGMGIVSKVLHGGFDVIVSSPYYLDLNFPAYIHHLYYPDMSATEIKRAQNLTVQDHRLAHTREGVASHMEFGETIELTAQQSGHILGGEACMWSELVSEDLLLPRVWSRLPAIAQRLWNGIDSLPIEFVYSEAAKCYDQLQSLGYENLATVSLRRHEEPLQALISMLEPIKWYGRLIGAERTRLRSEDLDDSGLPRPYNTDSPLDRWIDRLPPESLATRDVVSEYRSGANVSQWTQAWREQLKFCEVASETDRLIAEMLPASRALNRLAEIIDGNRPLELGLGGPFGEYVVPAADELIRIEFDKLLSRWNIHGEVIALKRGHINDTYRVGDAFLLQRINQTVFEHPHRLLTNLRAVQPQVKDMVPDLIATVDHSDFVNTSDGSLWRVFEYEDSRSFDRLPDHLCRAAGSAFGKFLKRLKALEVELEPGIDGFHQFEKYLAKLDEVRKNGIADDELAFVDRHRIPAADFSGTTQIIHGDCKVNNLLFHPTKDVVVAIVDLDTLMSAHPAFDYGDLIRSVATGAEVKETCVVAND